MRLPAGLLGAFVALAAQADRPLPISPAAERGSEREAAGDAARWLASRIRDDGRFRYRSDSAGRPLPGYNSVRHAGSLWALSAQAEADPAGSVALREPATRASRYLEHCCLRPLPGRSDRLALWSSADGDPLEAKLGAAGLALAAWSDRRRRGEPAPTLDELRALAAFIVDQQQSDGRFIAKFVVDAPDDRWQSLYYPGEAALGLLALARLDGDPQWRAAAAKALLHLAESRSASGDWPPDHWALIATAALLRQPFEPSAPLLRQVREIAERLLSAQMADGSFEPLRRSAPTATRLEALLAADAVLGVDDPDLRRRLRAAIGRGSRFLLDIRRLDGAQHGAVPRAALDSTDPRAGELRIDDTQHALSVWLGVVQLQNDN